jgi:hypothetical protein
MFSEATVVVVMVGGILVGGLMVLNRFDYTTRVIEFLPGHGAVGIFCFLKRSAGTEAGK